jgi:hypothetical protein
VMRGQRFASRRLGRGIGYVILPSLRGGGCLLRVWRVRMAVGLIRGRMSGFIRIGGMGRGVGGLLV